MATYNAYAPQNYPIAYNYPYLMQPVVPQPIAQPQAQQVTPAQQTQTQPQQINVQNNSSIMWCQGLAGAQAHTVAPGQSAMLLDSEPGSNSFYIKTTDISGMPMPLRIFDYEERLPKKDSDEEKEEGKEMAATSTFPDNYEETIRSIEERLDEITEIQDRIIEKITSGQKDLQEKPRAEEVEEKKESDADTETVKRRARKYEF